ncbi:uncharacterized protein L3040_002340 [Drepanopeziza brunnea f. sp. 'multigermtubi']|uniref:Uncharacterized protein n=1 Tax=Marssonina brunnea f. sp. multigermtubi (strain MB_m1) TaxID=1072389 RepID=K1X4H8_MARBU|nr:uncharacterized protein MBM_01934 [Drepanopeziza brunnea f. sp. 'multigermtubi' MB_m1]EKD19982.1 hypothetical protein MBM_01934 [Drepanopeziza brunnea f. sp. 'multigermtubi' MB_m1]KAJ5050457.1 hypothetical protein L3040_002340 [Drepanopeziza brunnea f. sp. 'multigermtubi']
MAEQESENIPHGLAGIAEPTIVAVRRFKHKVLPSSILISKYRPKTYGYLHCLTSIAKSHPPRRLLGSLSWCPSFCTKRSFEDFCYTPSTHLPKSSDHLTEVAPIFSTALLLTFQTAKRRKKTSSYDRDRSAAVVSGSATAGSVSGLAPPSTPTRSGSLRESTKILVKKKPSPSRRPHTPPNSSPNTLCSGGCGEVVPISSLDAVTGSHTPPSTPKTTSFREVSKLPFGELLATPPQTPQAFTLETPTPHNPNQNQLLDFLNTPREASPSLKPSITLETPPPQSQNQDQRFDILKTPTKTTPSLKSSTQPSPATPTSLGSHASNAFHITAYHPNAAINEEVEAGEKAVFGTKHRELSALELSREKRKIMVRKLSYGLSDTVRDIVKKAALNEEERELEGELARGYGLGIWKNKEVDAEKLVTAHFDKMSLWFAGQKL